MRERYSQLAKEEFAQVRASARVRRVAPFAREARPMRRMREESPGARAPPDFAHPEMTREDLPAVMELEKASFNNPWSPGAAAARAQPRLVHHLPAGGGAGGRGAAAAGHQPSSGSSTTRCTCSTWPRPRAPPARRGAGRSWTPPWREGRSRKCSLATLEVRKGNEPRHHPLQVAGLPPGRRAAELLRGRRTAARGRHRHGARLLAAERVEERPSRVCRMDPFPPVVTRATVLDTRAPLLYSRPFFKRIVGLYAPPGTPARGD